MPYVNIRLTPSVTLQQKKAIVARTTDMLVEILGKKPQHVHIVIDEVSEENWGFAGTLTDEFRSGDSN
jgi:4-oxalocrotonate tautomerase